MERGPDNQVTELLARWRSGERQALDSLMPLVYDELRRVARYYFEHERPGHTLQTTALVHEAYVRMAGQHPPEWKDRAHFYGVAARLMRQILVDHARACQAEKRGSGFTKVVLNDEVASNSAKGIDVIALDQALQELTSLNPQLGQIVELRFFSGLSIEDTSEVMKVSPATVKRHWTAARAWLYREMSQREAVS